MVLAVIATFFAAGYPARAITRVPVVVALAGRPAAPRQIRRSFASGVVALVIGFLFFSLSGASHGGGGVMRLIPGFVALIVGIILVSPFFLALLARVGGKAPIAVRLPPRPGALPGCSGSALSAISLGVLIAVIICAVAVARYSSVFDYVGPNMAANTINVYSPPTGPRRHRPNAPAGPAPSLASQVATVHAIASAVGATDIVELDSPRSACRTRAARPAMERPDLRGDAGAPAGLRHQPLVDPVQRGRAQLAAGAGRLGRQLTYGGGGKGAAAVCKAGTRPVRATRPVTRTQCLAHPVIQEESQLPIGTSAPNTVITESALQRLHLASQNSLDGWSMLANTPITSAQITTPSSLAAASSLSVESKNDEPTSAEIVNWATVFGIALALGVLAMSVGLIRSETASELRTLTATGASSRTRRSLTAVTAGGLAFLGALLGTVAAYVGLFGWFRSNALEGGLSDLINHVPWSNLFLIVIAMPAAPCSSGGCSRDGSRAGIAARPME